MLEKLDNNDFDKVYRIMERSFPREEYRRYEEQRELLADPLYSIYVLNGEAGSVKAFMAVWDFDGFTFLEHLAVDPKYRNRGIGAEMLKELSACKKKPICLEAEPPENEMSCRRIAFYQRNGFFLNEYPYMQPSISKGRSSIPLVIMTSGAKISKAVFEKMKAALYCKVYKCSN